MITTYRAEKSISGHSLDVLKSGLQKYIRRGEEEKALYCARELDLFAEAEGGERIRSNMIHRFMIIYLEDIGLGDIGLWDVVHKYINILLTERTKSNRNRLYEINAINNIVRLLCRARKTRACSFIRAWVHVQVVTPPIHEFTQQVINKSWDSLQSFFKLWDLDKRQLENCLKITGIELFQGCAWKRELKTKEQFLTLLLPLAAHIFNVTAEPRNYDNMSELVQWDNGPTEFTFDDYVYDKHTRTGNKTREYFVHISSYVENEVNILPDCFREAYERPIPAATSEPAAGSPAVDLETKYDFIVRAQLTCLKSRPDTYFARDSLGSVLFIKGPYDHINRATGFIEFQSMKRNLDIPYIEAWIEWLIPNRWSSVPLGIRNKLNCNNAYPFLICKSLYTEIPRKITESKCWPPTEVANIPKFNPLTMHTDQERQDWYNAIAFREKFRLGDLADRNFLSVGGRVYSVDEEISSASPINIQNQLKRKRFELFQQLELKYSSRGENGGKPRGE